MRKLRIGVIDLVARGPTRAWFARVMNANLASIMPQVVGVWCREEGHQVTFFCYTGIYAKLSKFPSEINVKLDVPGLRKDCGATFMYLLWTLSLPMLPFPPQ